MCNHISFILFENEININCWYIWGSCIYSIQSMKSRSKPLLCGWSVTAMTLKYDYWHYDNRECFIHNTFTTYSGTNHSQKYHFLQTHLLSPLSLLVTTPHLENNTVNTHHSYTLWAYKDQSYKYIIRVLMIH